MNEEPVPLLSLRHASFQYAPGGTRIFSDLNIDVFPGEFIALVGDSGTGKTTLLRLLANLYEPQSGELVQRGSTRGGFVFQTPVLVEWLTAEKNVSFPDRAPHAEKVREVLRDVGLEKAAKKYVSELSGGMRSRLQLARALYHRPDCMFLDEAFSQIQERLRVELSMLLKALRARYGFAAVMSTHHLADAVFLADRLFMLSSDNGAPRRVIEHHAGRRFSDASPDVIMSPAFEKEVNDLRAALWNATITDRGVSHAQA